MDNALLLSNYSLVFNHPCSSKYKPMVNNIISRDRSNNTMKLKSCPVMAKCYCRKAALICSLEIWPF